MLCTLANPTWAGNKTKTSATEALAQFLRSGVIGSLELIRLRREKIVAPTVTESPQIDPELIDSLPKQADVRLLKTACRLTGRQWPAYCNSSQWQLAHGPGGWTSFSKRINWQFADGVVMTSRDIVYMQQQLKQGFAETPGSSRISKPARLMKIFCNAGMVSFSVERGDWRAWDRDWNPVARWPQA
jgi:hypothetical protein